MIIAEIRPGETRCYTRSAYQYDRGQKLVITGIELPDSYEVHMSNQKEGGIAYACYGNAEGVLIPEAMFLTGEYVYVWLCFTPTATEESASENAEPDEDDLIEEKLETMLEIIVPVIKRPPPVNATDMPGDMGNLAYKDSAEGTYTPEGEVSLPEMNVVEEKATVRIAPGTANIPTAVTMPTFTTRLNDDVLEFGYTQGTVVPGTACVPTEVTITSETDEPGSDQETEVVTHVSLDMDGDPVFTGTEATIIVS